MKTRIVSVSVGGLGLAVIGLFLWSGKIESQTTTPQNASSTNAPVPPTNAPAETAPDVAPLPPAPAAVPATPPNPSQPDNAQAGVATAPASVEPEVKLSKAASDIARFAQGGINEEVMLAYIANSKGKFNLGSDQIVYLNDLGVSGNVVKAMIQRDAVLDAMSKAYGALAAMQPQQAQQPQQPVPVYPAPADYATNPVVPPPPQPPMDDSTAMTMPDDPDAYATADDVNYFYDSLAPFGSWIYVAGCGVCWQPTVWLGNHDWRPYCDRGRWLYSDCGWYWQSDYSWGWAPFHYGRWCNDPHSGWVWCPDRVWGPAWVSWRANNEYCGWAPLPPSAHFTPGRGFTFAHHAVAPGFEFGLRANQYTFIPIARMSDYTPARYAAAPWDVDNIHGWTRPITQITERDHHLFARGVDPNLVAAQSQTTVRQALVREVPQTGQHVQPEWLSKKGGSLVIYRPQLPAPTHRVFGNGMPAARPASGTLRTSVNPAPSGYPAGSLVMRGNQTVTAPAPPKFSARQNETIAEASERPATQWNYTSSGWQQARPTETRDYTVENGFARPNYHMHITEESTPGASSGNGGSSVYVIPGHYSAAQHGGSSGSPYTVYSSGNSGGNYAPHRSAGNNTYVVPGHFTASEHLNSSQSFSGRGSEPSGWSRRSDEGQGFHSESNPHNESHFESHGSSGWSSGSSHGSSGWSGSSHSASSSSSSSSSHSGGSSGGSSSGRR